MSRTDSMTSISGRNFLAPTPSDASSRAEKHTRHDSKSRKRRPSGNSFLIEYLITATKIKSDDSHNAILLLQY